MAIRNFGEMVAVDGLDDLRRDLKSLGAEFPKMLGQANKSAAEVVAHQAESNAAAIGSTAAHVAPSIKASSAAANAKVTLGNSSYPMALGAEFGAKKYPQFPPWRGNQWDPDAGGTGYFLHPAVRQTREEFMAVYEKGVDEVARKAGFK